jgi:hypothetical protein
MKATPLAAMECRHKRYHIASIKNILVLPLKFPVGVIDQNENTWSTTKQSIRTSGPDGEPPSLIANATNQTEKKGPSKRKQIPYSSGESKNGTISALHLHGSVQSEHVFSSTLHDVIAQIVHQVRDVWRSTCGWHFGWNGQLVSCLVGKEHLQTAAIDCFIRRYPMHQDAIREEHT